jgi:hypothetical protein
VTQTTSPQSVRSRQVVLAALAWLFAAAALSISGLLQHVPDQVVPISLWVCVAGLFVAYWRIPSFAAWCGQVDFRWLIVIHLCRFIGIRFLVLYSRGFLPQAFAVPAGWGDIAAASIAVLLLILTSAGPTRNTAFTRAALIIWNLLGLADILYAVFVAARMWFTYTGSMTYLTWFPLSLFPQFFVPLIITSHLLMLSRLRPRPLPAS